MAIEVDGITERRSWWRRKRVRYNLALFATAPIALLCSLIIWGVFEDRLPCVEITGGSIAVGGILFLFGVVLANFCYLLGPLGEIVARPANPQAFRNWVFGLGLAFSLLLIFAPALLLAISAALGPLPCVDEFGQRHG